MAAHKLPVEYSDIALMAEFGWSEHEVMDMSIETRKRLDNYLRVRSELRK